MQRNLTLLIQDSTPKFNKETIIKISTVKLTHAILKCSTKGSFLLASSLLFAHMLFSAGTIQWLLREGMVAVLLAHLVGPSGFSQLFKSYCSLFFFEDFFLISLVVDNTYLKTWFSGTTYNLRPNTVISHFQRHGNLIN